MQKKITEKQRKALELLTCGLGLSYKEIAEQAGFLRPNVLDAAHVTAERQHVADEHDRRNTGNAGRVGYVVHPPRAEHQRKEGAAHQECPTLQHGCGVLFLQVLGPYGVNNNAECADNTNDQRSGRNRHVGQAAVGGQHKYTTQRQHNGEHLKQPRRTLLLDADHQQNQHGGKILQNGAHTGTLCIVVPAR